MWKGVVGTAEGDHANFPKSAEEDRLVEVQLLRTENAYLKIASLGFERRTTQSQKARVIHELRRGYDLAILLQIVQPHRICAA